MKKLFNNHGESLIEVLVSLLIVALCILMLQGSIVTAARINKRNQDHIEPFIIEGSTSTNDFVQIDGKNTRIEIFKTEGGYYYYEK